MNQNFISYQAYLLCIFQTGFMVFFKFKDHQQILECLELHYQSFYAGLKYAKLTNQPVPSNTCIWSQILVSLLTGIKGISRKKGSDLCDGSDVKAANVWESIDTPRFNGCIPAGRVSSTSKKKLDISALNDIPFLFFVLWDYEEKTCFNRCRIWCIRSKKDRVFRQIAKKWYDLRRKGEIISNNFQLHPPRNKNLNEIRNTCGNFLAPLLFEAIKDKHKPYLVKKYDPKVFHKGLCQFLK